MIQRHSDGFSLTSLYSEYQVYGGFKPSGENYFNSNLTLLKSVATRQRLGKRAAEWQSESTGTRTGSHMRARTHMHADRQANGDEKTMYAQRTIFRQIAIFVYLSRRDLCYTRVHKN